MNKSIWYVSKYASPLKYGFASRHFYLAKEFIENGNPTIIISSDSNHLVNIPYRKPIYYKEEIDGVETWWIRTIKYKSANSFRRIVSWFDFEIKFWFMPKSRLRKPDILIISSLSLLTILNGVLLKRKYGCRLIFEIRDIWPLTLIEEGGFKPYNPFVLMLAWVEKMGYRNADIIVGTMPNLSEHVNNVMGHEMKCTCIPFGYDPSFYINSQLLPDDYIENFIPKGKIVVGYAGTIGLTNALEPFIDCAIAMKDNPHIHFLLVGGGRLLNQLKERANGLSNITFAPKVVKTQVQSVLSHCNILYLSVKDSRVWNYGLSLNKLIDYMMAAKPIIASYNGYPSMINEAGCGRFIPANNVTILKQTIEEYASLSQQELFEIGKRGRDWLVRNRPYEKIAKNYCKLMDGIY